MQGNVNIPDSTITTNLSFRQLVLMNMQQLTNFPYIENDFDALTDYELLCLVVKFLNDVIANQNEQNDSITRMYESFLALQTYVNNTKDTLEDAFNELDDYVRNYFDNLDVQEEINNKLDEMLEDGVLEQIIEQFLQSTAIWSFDTVADMKAATNLISGSTAKTLGYYSINDGGDATYQITNTQSATEHQESLNSGLYATLINPSSFKQLGKFEDDITVNDFNLVKSDVVDLEKNNLVLTETLELENITIKNGSISMGTSSATVEPANQICLLVKSNVVIDRVEFENIDAFYTILSDRRSSNITIKNCRFIDNAFACIVFDVENENVKVDNCYFNGIKYTVTSQFLYRYFIATGTKYTLQQNSGYTFSVRNAEFTNNVLLNNPLWEGLDTHGGENIIMKNNYIENCQTGIMANVAETIISNIKHKNIIIENNIIKGSANVSRTGMIVGGTSKIMAENIKIINNEIDSSSEENVNFGSIKIWYTKNSEISNNKITNSKTRGLNLGSKCINFSIKDNYIENQNAAPIVQSGYAIINVDIENNVLNGKGLCNQGFYNPLSGRGVFEHNIIYGCNSNGINYPNNFNMCYNGATASYVNYNDILHDQITNASLKITSQYVALGKTTFSKTMTVTGTTGNNYVICNTAPDELIDGLRILIGEDEYTVDHVVGSNIYLTSNLVSSYTNIGISPKAPTYSSL